MATSRIRKILVFVIPIALVIGGGAAWYVKYKIDTRPYSSISHDLKANAQDLVAAGIGNSFVDEPWFTKTNLQALSFYLVDEGQLRVILRNESSDSFFTVTDPKFMELAGFKTSDAETGICPAMGSTRVLNILVLATDRNLYFFDPTYGCYYSHLDYLKHLDAATEQVSYNSVLIQPEFDSAIRTQ